MSRVHFRMVDDILKTRFMVKKAKKEHTGDSVSHRF